MSSIGALVVFIELRSVPLVALPVNAVLRKILIKTLPPNRVIVKVQSNVCENGVLLCAFKRIEV